MGSDSTAGDHGAKVLVREAVSQALDAADGLVGRHSQVDERQAREDARTVATLPARDEDSLPSAYAVGYLARLVADGHPCCLVGRRTVVQGNVEDRVARHRRLVLACGQDDDVEGDTWDYRGSAALREDSGEEVVVIRGQGIPVKLRTVPLVKLAKGPKPDVEQVSGLGWMQPLPEQVRHLPVLP
jgi:hypothetical protein